VALPTVAIVALADDHTPPGTVLLNVLVAPLQSDVLPVIVPASGNELTVTICVATTVPQVLVTE
jgi:hypothetical protein